MKAKIADFLYISPTRQRLTIDLCGDFRKQYEKLKDADFIEAVFKKWFPNRSEDANAYLWVLCTAIAKKTGSTKEEVYKREIREAGEFTALQIKAEAVDDFRRLWALHGVGWVCEVVDDSALDGYKLVFAYNGSSTYTTQAFSRLLDNVIQEAKELEIEVKSEEELKSLYREETHYGRNH